MPRSFVSIPTGSRAARTPAPTAPRSGFDGHGGPRDGPPYPPTLGARSTLKAPPARAVPAKAWRAPLAPTSAERKLALEDAERRSARGLERFPDLRLAPPGALPQQRLEEPDVERVGLDDHGQARAHPRTRNLHPKSQGHALPGPEPRVERFAREVEGHLAPDEFFLPASGQHLPRPVHQLRAQDDPRGDVGRERVADARAGHAQRDDRDVAGTVTCGPRRRGDREPRAHHVGVVDAAPQMPPLRHVAVLALDALTGEPARLPFVVGVLEQLAVQRESVGCELVTAAAELGFEEGGRARDPVVRQRLPWDAARERAVTAGRAEALVAPHVAAGARHALGAERAIVRGVGPHLVAFSDQRRLLGERRVTRETSERRPRIALEHLHELTLEARTRRRGMRALAPVGELRGVTGPARLGVERGLQRREARGRRALRRQRRAPVPPEKVLDRIGADGGGAEQHGQRRRARGAKGQSHRRKHDSAGRLGYSRRAVILTVLENRRGPVPFAAACATDPLRATARARPDDAHLRGPANRHARGRGADLGNRPERDRADDRRSDDHERAGRLAPGYPPRR